MVRNSDTMTPTSTPLRASVALFHCGTLFQFRYNDVIRPWKFQSTENAGGASGGGAGIRRHRRSDSRSGEAFAQIDLIICLGGDGTLMFVASRFQKMETPVPPMMVFSMGSLGFLTPFSHDCFETSLHAVLHGSTSVTLRMRLKCEIIKADHHVEDEQLDPDELADIAAWTTYEKTIPTAFS